MSFKPRVLSQTRKITSTIQVSKLTGQLRQTDLNNSNDKGDVALFDLLDNLLLLLFQFQTDINNSVKKTDDIDLTTQVTKVLPPDNGGSYSSTYTPTLTNVANLTASTASELAYYRNGNTVTVFGKVNVQTTAAGNTRLRISLPVLSYFLNSFECGGVACCPTVAGEVATIFGDTTNFDAEMRWQTAGAATFDMFFSFSYQLIAKT